MIVITQKSMIDGKTRSMELNVTKPQLDEYYGKKSRRLIQHIMPDLTDDEREFIMTGITPEQWDKTFGEE